jgi:hypothetical protein
MYDDSESSEPFAPRLFRALVLTAVGAALHLLVPLEGTLPVPDINPVKVVYAELRLPVAVRTLSIQHALVFARPADELERKRRDNHTLQAIGTIGTSPVAALPVGLAAIVQALPDVVPFNLARFTGPALEVAPADRFLPAPPERVNVPAPPASPDGSSDEGAVVTVKLAAHPPELLERVPTRSITAPAAPASLQLNEEDLVRQLLAAYTGAFSRLDVDATRAVWPSVDGKALERAYGQLSSQRLTLQSCGITISGSTANARCRGSATYTPRIGRRSVEIAAGEWTFDLSKKDTAWHIVNTFVR